LIFRFKFVNDRVLVTRLKYLTTKAK